MIMVWTAVHGKPPIVQKCFDAIDAELPGPFIHMIGDDFSPGNDSQLFIDTQGPIVRNGETVGERKVYHCRDLGETESPSMGASFRWIFQQARATPDLEALLVVESDVILHPGIVAAFREAEQLYGSKCGAVAPLYTDSARELVLSIGGMNGGAETERIFLSIPPGTRMGTWDQSGPPRLDELWWAHLAALWITPAALHHAGINPDPAFELFYLDHDFSKQINSAGLKIVVTDRATAEHTRQADSTGLRWPDNEERTNVAALSYEQLKKKWNV
jgi:hypothetical protein